MLRAFLFNLFINQKILTMTTQTFEKIYSDLCHRTDGPVTKSVVIWRFTELCKTSNYSNDDLAEALEEILTDFQTLDSNEYSHSL